MISKECVFSGGYNCVIRFLIRETVLDNTSSLSRIYYGNYRYFGLLCAHDFPDI